jgi:hypothetical protein
MSLENSKPRNNVMGKRTSKANIWAGHRKYCSNNDNYLLIFNLDSFNVKVEGGGWPTKGHEI